MEIQLMVGRYAGEIRDVNSRYARQMIKDGRAVDPNIPMSSGVATAPPAPLDLKPLPSEGEILRRNSRRSGGGRQ